MNFPTTIAALLTITASGLAGVNLDQFLDGQAVIRVEDDCDIETVNAEFGTVTLAVIEGGSRPTYLLALPDGANTLQFIAMLDNDDCVKDAEPNFEVGNPDPTTQEFFFGSSAPAFWTQPIFNILDLTRAPVIGQPLPGPAAPVVVAIIDTGVDPTHPLMQQATVLEGYSFVNCDAPGADDACTSGPSEHPSQVGEGMVGGHGTFVAGLVHLVAPEAQILPVKVMDPGGTSTTFQVAQGMQAVIAMAMLPENAGTRFVMNISLGSTAPSDVINDMLELALGPDNPNPISVIAAMGNDAVEFARFPAGFTLDPELPAGLSAVAATQNNDVVADFSNFGNAATISAPGVDLLSITPGGAFSGSSGTSFANALVTGAVARARGYDSPATPAQVLDLLAASAADIDGVNPGLVGKLGEGRLDVGALMDLVGGTRPRIKGDIDGSGQIDSGDLNLLLGAFGQPEGYADLDGDGLVGSADLNELLATFGGS